MGSVVFRVKDDSYSTFYKVYIQKYADAKKYFCALRLPLTTWEISAATKQQLYCACRR